MEDKKFKKALDFVLLMEGGYVNHPDDSGGETNFGITKSVYDMYRKSKNLPARSVKNITSDEVEEIYYKKYYKASGADRLDEVLGLIHFDTAVNMGVSRAGSFLTLSQGNKDKYLKLRRDKYIEFSQVNPGQKVFLKGWLNRLARLENYIKQNYEVS